MFGKLVFASLLLLTISYSGFTEFCSSSILSCSIFPLVMMITVLLLVLLNMFAASLNAPQLEAWVKTEIRELITGAILISLVVAIAFGTNSLASVLSGEENIGLKAQQNLDQLINNLKPAYVSIIKVSHYLSLLTGYSYVYPVPLWYASYTYMNAPYSGLGSLFSYLSQASQAITNSIFLYTALKILVKFFTSTEFSITFASIALAFRVFPFTRQLGNTLIAVWFGVTIIFPFSIVMMSFTHDLIISSSTPKIDLAPSIKDYQFMQVKVPAGFAAICGNDWLRGFTSTSEVGWGLAICLPGCLGATVGYAACFASCWETVTQVIYPVTVMGFQVTWGSSFIAQALSGSSIDPNVIFNVVTKFLQNLNYIIVLSYIDAFIVSIITVIGTKSISTALGGEYYLAGIQRLV